MQVPGSPELRKTVKEAVVDAKEAIQHAAAAAARNAAAAKQAAAAAARQAATAAKGTPAAAQEIRRQLQTFMGNKTDCAVLFCLLTLTTALSVGSGLETRHKWLRQVWVETLFGPFG
jgi:hypothetical protein